MAVPHGEQRVPIPNNEQTDPVTTAVVSRLLHDALTSSPLSNTDDESNTTTTTTPALPPDPLPNNVPILYRPGKLPSKPTPPARITRQQTARQRALAYGALNLAADGSPLTYSKAKTGPDAALWLQAESEEFDRLFDSKTISPIHLVDQPQCRRRDTTYFNPQTTQKVNTMGKTTYRIRGTAGGDRINYSEPTSAQTAAMTVVKLLIHSVIIG